MCGDIFFVITKKNISGFLCWDFEISACSKPEVMEEKGMLFAVLIAEKYPGLLWGIQTNPKFSMEEL